MKYQIKVINSYTYIDKNGYILENSTVKQEVPIIVGFSLSGEEALNNKRLENNDLEKLNDVTKIIAAAENIKIDSLITEINAENTDNYQLYLESKNKIVYIGDTSDLTNKMLYVQQFIENEEGNSGKIYVNGDISSGFLPYFRSD